MENDIKIEETIFYLFPSSRLQAISDICLSQICPECTKQPLLGVTKINNKCASGHLKVTARTIIRLVITWFLLPWINHRFLTSDVVWGTQTIILFRNSTFCAQLPKIHNVLQNNSLSVNTSWEHLLLCCHERNNLQKEPGGLGISIQSIFALYLQTGLLGTLEEKKSLRFLSTAYERRVWSNRGWEFPWSVTLYQAQQSKALPRQFRATVFRLLWKMVREKLGILVNSKIQAVNLRVLFRTDGVGQPSCRLQMLPTLKSSPGLLAQCLKGLEKHEKVFWDLFMILECKQQEQLCSWTVPGWHRSPRALRGGQSCSWLCPGPAKAAYTGCKTCLNITPDILTGDQFKPKILPLYPAKRVIFFLNQPLLGCFKAEQRTLKKIIFFKVSQKFW